jgi:transcriptional regulator with XRE-family HTH domain
MQAQSFGDWLKRKRKSLDLTQEELAKQVGCSAAAIRKFEAEERRPSVQIVGRLAGIFDIPLKEQPGFRRFARGELRSAPAEAEEDFPWQASTRHIPSNLPATVTSLVGREQEISLVREYLVDPTIRLVSLIGPPGIGKTRLSLETARTILSDFPNGVFFVALAPLEDASLFAFTVAQVLGFLERTRQPAIQQLTDGIRDKQMLIVLDNCEHLIEDVAMLASELLSACPRLKILVTSRESLRIPGERLSSH